MEFYGNIPGIQFLGVMPSEDASPLSGDVLLGTLNLGRTGPQSFVEFYVDDQELPGDDQEIWKRVSLLFCKSMERERVDLKPVLETVEDLTELFNIRYAPQLSPEALALVMSESYRPEFEFLAECKNRELLQLPENESLLRDILAVCTKKGITLDEAINYLVFFDWHIGCALRQALMAPYDPIENGEVIHWVHDGCAIKHAACIIDDEKPRLTPELLRLTWEKYRNFSENQISFLGRKIASLTRLGGFNRFVGIQGISRDFVQKLRKFFREGGIPYRVVTNRTSTVGIIIHEKFLEELTMVELPEKCGDTCAFLLRDVLFISVNLTSKKKDLGKPGQENHEDQYEELMEFCKDYPIRAVFGNFEHNITGKLNGLEYAFPNCEDHPDTVHYFPTDMQTRRDEANTVVKMKKDFILISSPGSEVSIHDECVLALGHPSATSIYARRFRPPSAATRGAYLPHLEHPMPHLYVEAHLFMRNDPTDATGAQVSEETSK